MLLSSRAIGPGLALALVAVTRSAAARPPSCIAQHAGGQDARRGGQLLSAKKQFLACEADERCPAMIRRECSEFRQALLPSIPSVVFAAVDQNGNDTTHVQVLRDGQPLVTAIDLRAIEMDPGEYNFRFVGPGGETKDENVLVREGEKDRRVTVDFRPPAPAQPLPSPSTLPPTPPPLSHPSTTSNAVGFSLLGLAAAGAGLGTYFGLQAKSDNTSSQVYCDAENHCHSQGVTLRNSAFSKALGSDIAFGAGVVSALAGGAILVFDLFPGREPTTGNGLAGASWAGAVMLTNGGAGMSVRLSW